jgi:hypothetical protein
VTDEDRVARRFEAHRARLRSVAARLLGREPSRLAELELAVLDS